MAEQVTLVLEAASPEEAKAAAAAQWNLSPNDINIEQVGEVKRLFGLLGKKTTFQATPIAPLPMLGARKRLQELLDQMGLETQVSIGEGDCVLNIQGEDRQVILGTYGEPLRATEYLLNIMLRGQFEETWIRLDSDGYREHREENLAKAAVSAAEEARRRSRPVSLDPMTSWERRIIHLALRDRDDVETRSVGDDPMRRVVIWPKKTSAPVRSAFRPRRSR